MLKSIREFFTKNVWLKIGSLLLALVLWFYVVNELHKGSEEDRQFLNKILPSEGLSAKKLSIKPILTGTPPRGYMADSRKAVVAPDYCIVVGTKDLLSKIRFAYTMPIDVRGVTKSFTRSVPLNPIAPGIYMEETLVQVTVSVEKQ
ncbi:MAG: YbbR-like domain-containing protein [Candidatus Omnitrophica bacterium]|nr:YbbR-like domain-containing protein [Candidatus Omnitrophota bacterium]